MKKIIILSISLFLFVMGISCVAATDVNSDSVADALDSGFAVSHDKTLQDAATVAIDEELGSGFAGISESTPLSMVPYGRSPKLNDTIGCCHDAPLSMGPSGSTLKLNDTIGIHYNGPLSMVPAGRPPKLNDTIGCCHDAPLSMGPSGSTLKLNDTIGIHYNSLA